MPWSVFTEGEWDTIGGPEQAGGAGASLLDQARDELAVFWAAEATGTAEAAETAALWLTLEPAKSCASVSYTLDTAVRIDEGAIQVHGGMGFTWELGLHYYVRHILMLRELVHGLWE